MTNVYQIGQDYDRFQYILHASDEDFIKLDEKEGEFIENWKVPTWILTNFRKKDKKKRTDFQASSFFSGILIMEKQWAEKMLTDLNISAQLLPIHTPEFDREFVFVNLLGKVKAVVEHFFYTSDELEQAYDKMNIFDKNPQPQKEIFPELHNKFAFNKNIIEKTPIFRDEQFCNFYFCNDAFVEWTEKNRIGGLDFENAGIVR